MSLDAFLDRITAAKSVPYELLAYQRFLDESDSTQKSPDPYLLFEPRVRFSPEADDVIVARTSIAITPDGNGSSITHPQALAPLRLPGLDAQTAERILTAIDGNRSVIGAQVASGATPQQLDRFLLATFGKLVLAPRTIERFEARISGTELVRFVGAPYEIQRAYWANMADCRERMSDTLLRMTHLDAWLGELRALHVLLLLGADGRSFYRAYSPLGRRDARPGAFYTTPTRTQQEAGLCLFIDGPRVSAPLLGGRNYHQLLCCSVGDPEALLPTRCVADASHLDWGAVYYGLARHDSAAASWFCPPRPLTERHFHDLFRTFRDCLEPDSAVGERAPLDAMADFHWQFVRLHPFRCANQSLSMNIVNALRVRAKLEPIPHLLLDQLALRLTREAYRRIHRRASRHWAVSDDAGGRWRKLAERRQTVDQFVTRLAQFEDAQSAARYVASEPRAAALALVLD